MGFERITPGDTMNKSNIALSVLAALGVGAGINSAIQSAARENNVSTIEAQQAARGTVIEAATVFKLMGLKKDQLEDETAKEIGVNKSEIKHITDAVMNRDQFRDSKSRFNNDVNLFIPVNETRPFQLMAQAICEPLKLKSETPLYLKCVSDNSVVNGAKICKGGVHVFNAPRFRATDSMLERIQRRVGVSATTVLGDPASFMQGQSLSVCPEPESVLP